MSIEFYNTGYGRVFFENQLPNLIKSLNRVADSLERIEENKLKNKSSIHPQSNTYVLYQENSRELQVEGNGAISDMILAKSFHEVKSIVYEWLYTAESNGYLPIHDLDVTEFMEEIIKSNESVLWLYHKGDEDSPLYYSITVKSFGVTEESNEKTSSENARKIGHDIKNESLESLEEGLKKLFNIKMTDSRKDEIIGNFLTWMLEHHSNDVDLYRVLHNLIGLSKDELHMYGIESLDEYFKTEKEILTKLLRQLNVDDIELWYDDGVLHARDEEGHSWVAEEFYHFITDECLCFNVDGIFEGPFVPEDILDDYISLSIANGVVPGADSVNN